MKSLVSLAIIGALCALLLAGTHRFTTGSIQANREAHAWRVAFDLTGGAFPTEDLQWEGDRLELTNGFVLRRGTVNGYAGAIELLAAFRPTAGGIGSLAGVRVTRHRETPGLGDFVDTAKSTWILQFANRRPDRVDAVTGATITSEAVKRGVLALLQTTEPRPPAGNSRFEPVDNSQLTHEQETGSAHEESVPPPDARPGADP